MKVYSGEFKKIYDPSENETEKWYINDHTIINGKDGWHLFGITHAEPADPLNEIICAHAITQNISEVPLKKLESPIVAEKEKGELHFWAPHIIQHNGLYYMFYCAGSLNGHDSYRIHLATSKDLYYWEKCEENLVGNIPCHAAEILKINGDYYITHCGWGQSGVYLAPLYFEL